MFFDVNPELLRHLGAGQRLRTADLRQRRAQRLRGENTLDKENGYRPHARLSTYR